MTRDKLKNFINVEAISPADLDMLERLQKTVDKVSQLAVDRGRDDWAADLNYEVGYALGIIGRLSKWRH